MKISPDYIPPVPQETHWISPAHAAKILNVTPRHARRIAKDANIPTRRGKSVEGELSKPSMRFQKSLWFSLEHIYVEQIRRDSLELSRAIPEPTPDEPLRPMPYIRSNVVAPPGDVLISMEEAAFMLGVSQGTVRTHIYRGRLFAWQKDVGKSGSKVWLSGNQVYRYAHDPDRLRRNKAIKDGARKPVTNKPTYTEDWLEDQQMVGLPTDGTGRNSERDYGIYYNTGQVAQLLRISKVMVGHLRRMGQLNGHKSPRTPQESLGGGLQWWFYLKTEVDSLHARRQKDRKIRYPPERHRND